MIHRIREIWLKVNVFPVFWCVVLTAIIYYPVLLGYWAINGSDGLHMYLPINTIVARSFMAGTFPHWNSLFNLGQPVIDATAPPFHPALLLYMFFDSAWAHTFEIVAGLFMMLLGAWLFLRSLGFGKCAVSIGSLCYALCGPVFFLHSYHLGFMGILLLPWCLYFFHQYDRSLRWRWLWLSVLALIIGIQSADADTSVYLYAGCIIDRLASLPQHPKKPYILTWLFAIFLPALTGLAVYVPLYEWIAHSSRTFKTSEGILTPSLFNLLSGIFTNHWIRDLPYDVFYYYFGPAFIWLVLVARPDVRINRYQERYFLYTLSIPLFYLAVRFLQQHSSVRIGSLDAWRSMFVFCLALTILAAEGIQRLLRAGILELRLTAACAALTVTLAFVCIKLNLSPRAIMMLFIAAGGMVMVVSGWRKTPVRLRCLGVVTAVTATVFTAAFGRTTIIPSCAWNSAVVNLTVQPPYLQCKDFLKNLEYYRRLAVQKDTGQGSWRVSLFGGTDNTTALAGLKTLPNYTSIYNKRFEETLCSDGLIKSENIHPYWMTLEKADAKLLSLYGVRFLASLRDDLTPSPPEGWVSRSDLSWPSHRVWENIHYLGRAYIISSSGRRRGGVDFIKDTHSQVTVKASLQEGEQLVLADLDYPGWEVFVDGTRATTRTYHGCLRSVYLSEGVHVVTWLYTAQTQKKAFLLSGISLVALWGGLSLLVFLRSRIS